MATLYGAEARPTGTGRIEDLLRRFRRGDFDLVSVGRSLIGDPDWVAKMSDGRGAQIRPFRRADIEFLSALCLSPCWLSIVIDNACSQIWDAVGWPGRRAGRRPGLALTNERRCWRGSDPRTRGNPAW
jgi:hypothetical protein